jgi:hypothetical protein
MSKNWDLTLQFLFGIGLIVLAGLFYLTRLAPLRADNPNNQPVDPYALYTSVYQFEQEERRLITSIKVRKSDYASDLAVFIQEKLKLEQMNGLSELEKREKMKVLEELYSAVYFQRKLDLIDEEQLQLDNLLKVKCLKYCTYEDLPGGA